MGTTAFFDRSSHRLRRNPSVAQARQHLTGARPLCRYATSPRIAGSHPLQGSLKRCNRYASLVKGGGFAVGKLGGINALATKQKPHRCNAAGG